MMHRNEKSNFGIAYESSVNKRGQVSVIIVSKIN